MGWRERVAGDRRVWERRRPGSDDAEVVLDEDAAPATLTSEFGGAEYRGFVRGISDAKISPDGERVAYTVDAAGDEKYVCEFLPEGVLPPVRDVDACVAWGGDGDLYALRTDATGRPHEVWRIKDGTESLVFREDDQRFRIEVIPGETVLFLLRSRDAAEVRGATGAVLVPRRQGVEVAACDLRDGVLWRVEDSALLRGEDAVAVPARPRSTPSWPRARTGPSSAAWPTREARRGSSPAATSRRSTRRRPTTTLNYGPTYQWSRAS